MKTKTHKQSISWWSGLESTVLWGTACLCVGIAIVTVFSHFTPFDMDEFVHYHALMCRFYPGNALNLYREACHAYDLDFFGMGWVLPLRAFAYSGSSPALYYLPLFLLWRSPLSARLLGVLFLMAQAACIARMYRYKFWAAFTALLLFFPYAFQHLVDTGPIMFQTTSIFLLFFLFRRWHLRPMGTSILVGLIITVGIWTKLVYLWLLPGIGVLFLIAITENAKKWKKLGWLRLALQAILAGSIITVLVGGYFYSTAPGNPHSFPVWDQITGSNPRALKDIIIRWHNMPVFQRLLNPLDATARIFSVTPMPGIGVLYAVVAYLSPFFLSLGLLAWKKKRRLAVRPLALFTTFIVTLVIIARTPRAGQMHHTVLALPFIILCVCELLAVLREAAKRKKLLILRMIGIQLVTAMLALNIFCILRFPSQTYSTPNTPSKVDLHTVLKDPRIAEHYLYVITDWGMYYYQALFGNVHQAVVYIEPLNSPSQIDALRRVAKREHRKLLFVYNALGGPESDLNLIRRSFNVLPCGKQGGVGWEFLAEPEDGTRGCPGKAKTIAHASSWTASLLQ